MIRFTAHCAQGHDRIDFTEPGPFEDHMTTEHEARKRWAGMAAPGWGKRGILPPHPHKAPPAPKGTAKLTAILAKWQDEPWPTPKRWWGPKGPERVVGADWETEESTPRTFHEATA